MKVILQSRRGFRSSQFDEPESGDVKKPRKKAGSRLFDAPLTESIRASGRSLFDLPPVGSAKKSSGDGLFDFPDDSAPPAGKPGRKKGQISLFGDLSAKLPSSTGGKKGTSLFGDDTLCVSWKGEKGKSGDIDGEGDGKAGG